MSSSLGVSWMMKSLLNHDTAAVEDILRRWAREKQLDEHIILNKGRDDIKKRERGRERG